MAKRHLDQERSNLQSTKVPAVVDADDTFPEPIKTKTHNCFYQIVELNHKAKSYMDLTGRFPHQSLRGNNYLFVCYNYDSNAILVEPLNNREADTIISAWKKCHERLTKKGRL